MGCRKWLDGGGERGKWGKWLDGGGGSQERTDDITT
jgi:hypothetical protein